MLAGAVYCLQMIDPALKAQIRQARGKFAAMAGAYSLGVFNDNFFKQAAIFLVIDAGIGELRGIAALLLAVPYVLFASYCGWLADRFSKRTIVIGAKALEVVAMVCGAVGVVTVNWWLIMAMVFLMGWQSAIFSPALNGSIPELYPASFVTTANARIKVVTTAAILLGMVLAGYALEVKGEQDGQAAEITALGKSVVAVAVVAVAALGLVVSFGAPRRPAASPKAAFPWAGPVDTFKQLVHIHKDSLLAKIVWADVFIWSVGALQLLIIDALGTDRGGQTASTAGLAELRLSLAMRSNLQFAALVGIAVGGMLAARLAVGRRWYRVLVPACLGLSVLAVAVLAVPYLPQDVQTPALFVLLSLSGVAAGVFMIPCESFIQVRAAPEEKGAVIAAANFAIFCGIILSGLLIYVLDKVMAPTTFFASIALVSVPVAVWLHVALRREDRA